MRTAKLLTATLAALAGGWLLILAYGIFFALTGGRTHPDWYPVPSHPVARIATYLTITIVLQLLSAWFLMPASEERSATYWRSYAARVALCTCACFGAVVAILFVLLMFCSDC
jgi:cytochrome bd-type quinol oxidase subunit 2